MADPLDDLPDAAYSNRLEQQAAALKALAELAADFRESLHTQHFTAEEAFDLVYLFVEAELAAARPARRKK